MALDPETKPSDLGMNRTGIQAAPKRAKEMADNTDAVPADPDAAVALAEARAELAAEAPPVGTMPVPGTVKGAAKTAKTALKGQKATVFLDKLGARLAFERTGVRLYDAMLAKVPGAKTEKGTFSEEELLRFRDEELAHFLLVKEAIESLGGDPTAQTPAADVKAVESSGILLAIGDPRTTLSQCLEALHTAELADNAGWKLLIAMAEGLKQEGLARRFTEALAEEDVHLRSVERWVRERLEIELGAKMPPLEFGEPAAPAS
jgi:rubrerythrin